MSPPLERVGDDFPGRAPTLEATERAMSEPTFVVVHACAVLLLGGVVLQTEGVSVGRGRVVDWRQVRCGETLLEDGDAFDCAQAFVGLVGVTAAAACVDAEEGELPPPSKPAPPQIHAYRPDEHGRRIREFSAPGGFKVSVEFDAWRDNYSPDGDARAAAFTAKLAEFTTSEAGR